MRNGKLLGRRNFSLKGQEFPDAEILSCFVSLYYELGTFIPDEVLLPEVVEDGEVKAEWLTEKRAGAPAADDASSTNTKPKTTRKVEMMVPQRGSARLIVLAQKNAASSFVTRRDKSRDTEAALQKLQIAAEPEAAAAAHRVLRHLAHPGHGDGGVDGRVPRRRAGQGRVPHVQGEERDERRLRVDVRGPVAALSPLEDGRGRPRGGPKKGWVVPDLLVIDGGKGHCRRLSRR